MDIFYEILQIVAAIIIGVPVGIGIAMYIEFSLNKAIKWYESKQID